MTEALADRDRAEFHEARASGIGATDSPKILGLSKWGSALTVYRDKVDPDAEREQSLPAWLGNRIQDVVAELYAAQTGQRIRADNRHHRHPKYDWLVCHLDYRAWGNPKLLVECKTRAYMNGWGDEGTNEVPPDIWVQVQHEMAVTGAEVCDIAVLFGHHTFRVYRIARDEAFITSLITRLEQFWLFNVEARIPPEASASPLDDAILRRDHPEDDGEILPATPEQDALARGLRLARQNLAAVIEAKDAAENKLKEVIGDHTGIRGAFGVITWKRSKPSVKVNWEAVAGGYREVIDNLVAAVPGKAFDMDVTPEMLDAIQSIHTSEEPGSRRFYVKFAEENE